VIVEVDENGRNFQQRVGPAVEAAGLDIDDHRQETAKAVRH
jgi:hypothetical protein